MSLNNAAMQEAADALIGVLLYAQLHSGLAGESYTDNVTSAAREAITWTATTGLGDFGLDTQLEFSGGDPAGDVYSLTLWSASTNGTCFGEFPITDGDTHFNSNGDFYITVADFTGITDGGS